ncbi:MAG: hypothetical protein ACRCUM_01850 [Mycoplasmoidaceae bacterium]
MKKIYPLASSLRRFFARLLDLTLLFGIIVIFYFVFFSFDPVEANFKSYLFFSYMIFIWLAFFIYFVLIPSLNKGRTLFIFAFKMRIFDSNSNDYFFIEKIKFKNDKHKIFLYFFVNMFKREFFVWNIFCIINFSLGIVLLSLGDDEGLIFIKSLFMANAGIDNAEGTNSFAMIFTSLYSINLLIIIGIFINFWINSSKRNIIDVFSSTVTLYLKEIDPKSDNLNKDKKNIINYGLPGEILDSVFDEIYELEKEKDNGKNKRKTKRGNWIRKWTINDNSWCWFWKNICSNPKNNLFS